MIHRQLLNTAINTLKVNVTLPDVEKVCGCLSLRRCFMGQAKIVNVGVDTLVLNAFYIDERGRPVQVRA